MIRRLLALKLCAAIRLQPPYLTQDMNSGTRTPLIAGNWKMHGSLQSCEALVAALRSGMADSSRARMLVCPPPVYLQAVSGWLAGTRISLGAQNLAEHAGSGAYTGEVSGTMLTDLGCEYVIVGHSERRAYFGEDDRVVAAKFAAAQEQGLIPILCVGETLHDREAGNTQAVVRRQVESVLSSVGVEAFGSAVLAYEPVWAIGTGRTASPQQAQEVHSFIRGLIRGQDDIIARDLTILYGGSVKGANARHLLAMEDIDGGLVGGASLDAREFLGIFGAAVA